MFLVVAYSVGDSLEGVWRDASDKKQKRDK